MARHAVAWSRCSRGFDAAGRATDGSGLVFDDWRNWLLVECWARDARAGLSHVFVARTLRQRLLKYARGRKDFARYVDRAAALQDSVNPQLRQPAERRGEVERPPAN